jgi:hypothetical protein
MAGRECRHLWTNLPAEAIGQRLAIEFSRGHVFVILPGSTTTAVCRAPRDAAHTRHSPRYASRTPG